MLSNHISELKVYGKIFNVEGESSDESITVAVTAFISATLDSRLLSNRPSLIESISSITVGSDEEVVSGSFKHKRSTRTAIFTPAQPLRSSTTYDFTIKSSDSDANTFSFEFTTEALCPVRPLACSQ